LLGIRAGAGYARYYPRGMRSSGARPGPSSSFLLAGQPPSADADVDPANAPPSSHENGIFRPRATYLAHIGGGDRAVAHYDGGATVAAPCAEARLPVVVGAVGLFPAGSGAWRSRYRPAGGY